MSELVKDQDFAGWVEGTPGDGDYSIRRVSQTLGAVVARRSGVRRLTDIVVPLTSAMRYITQASGVEGGWKQVYWTPAPAAEYPA